MNKQGVVGEQALYRKVTGILDAARSRVARTVNAEMVVAYWRIGREVVEVEQRGTKRADYGDRVLERLSAKLRADGVKGMGVANLRTMRQFFLAFPAGTRVPELSPKSLKSQAKIRQTLSGELVAFHPNLSWSHYVALLRVPSEQARAFYEIEAGREAWSVSQLERQIAARVFQRLSSKGNASQLAKHGQRVTKPEHVLKDPVVLEFLSLKENPADQERGLEQRIIDRLEAFMLELGKGFCFVGRQRRFTVEGDHFYVDLVFYNRLLRCFVLVDLKLTKLTHQDLGQMQMYVNWFDRYQKTADERPTIGIVVCSDKNEAMVRISLPEGPKVLAARYADFLPSENELAEQLARDREDAERALHLEDALSHGERGGSVRVAPSARLPAGRVSLAK